MSVKYKKGFGLIETLIASGIIVMMAGSAVGVATLILNRTKGFDDTIVATNIASSYIEEMHAKRISNLTDDEPDTDWDYGIIFSGEREVEVGSEGHKKQFIRIVEVTKSTVDPNSLDMTVNVTKDNQTVATMSTTLTNWKVAQ